MMLWKYKSNGSLTRWKHRHCRWNFASRYISSIYIYTLSRFLTSNMHRSNKENDFTLKKARSKRYLAVTITDADCADDLVLHSNTPTQAESLLHNLEQAAGCIGLYVNADKTEYMCFKQKGAISTLSGNHLKLVDYFTYLGSSISSTESYANIHLVKA